MRKKDLLTQNIALFEQLEKCRLKIKELKKELVSKDNIITKLQSADGDGTAKTVSPTLTVSADGEAEPRSEEPKKAQLPLEIDYGASVIGKIVISAAKYCNRLVLGTCENKKDQINLILGATEVAKAEIFKIVNSDIPYEEKCAQTDEQYSKTTEYFADVFAQ